MATLAALSGAVVTTCADRTSAYHPVTTSFRRHATMSGTRQSITDDLVVVGNAISRGNAELRLFSAQDHRRCEAIRDQFFWGAAHRTCGRMARQRPRPDGMAADSRWADPSMLVGGIAPISANTARLSRRRGRDFVIEGDMTARISTRRRSSSYLPTLPSSGSIGLRRHLRRPR
jgi:hypothetical protein